MKQVSVKRHICVKIFFGILLWFAGGAAVYCVEIVLMPITYYEKEGNDFVKKEYGRDICSDICEYLNRYYAVQFDTTPLNDKFAGATEADALRVAEFYKVNYVLYGSIKKDSNSLYAELKLYNNLQKKNELFFSGDSVQQYDRLIKTISGHILDWYHTERDKMDTVREEIGVLRRDITNIRIGMETKQRTVEEKVPKDPVINEFSLRFPIRVGYWTYTNGNLLELVQGSVEATAGVEVIPELQFPLLYGMRNELSISLLFGYRYGLSAQYDTVLRVHDIIINPALTYHLNCYTNNWLLIGAGAFFELGIWHIEEEKYNSTLDYQQPLTGISALLGYSYRLNKLVTIDLGVNAYFYFTSNTPPVIRPYLGTVIKVLGGTYEI